MSGGSCSFTGTAREVTVRGQGMAALMQQDPFKDGKVRLSPARTTAGSELYFDHPPELMPVRMHREGPFAVRYEHGSPVRIRVMQGGEPGWVKGTPGCEAGCEVTWTAGGGVKEIDLSYEGARPALLVDTMPFGDASLSAIALRGARGMLTCGSDISGLSGDYDFSGSTLALSKLRIEKEGLGVDVRGEPHAATPWTPVLAGAAALLVAAVAVVALRRRPPVAKPGPDRRSDAPPTPIEVFCSYAASEEDVKLWVKLKAHLSALERTGAIVCFDARGAPSVEAEEHLGRAAVIVMLVSADYIADDHCMDVEVKRAMERHAAGDAKAIPVLLRACNHEALPFAGLMRPHARPVATSGDVDGALTGVVEEIAAAAKAMRERKTDEPLRAAS